MCCATWRRALRDALADRALRPAGASVLDFGCGARPYEPWFAAAGARYSGADIDGGPRGAHRRRRAPAGRATPRTTWSRRSRCWSTCGTSPAICARRGVSLRADGRLLLSTHGTWLYHPHPSDFRRWTAEGLRARSKAQGFALLRMGRWSARWRGPRCSATSACRASAEARCRCRAPLAALARGAR